MDDERARDDRLLLIVRPEPSCQPGPLADWLAAAGARVTTVAPDREALPALEGYSGVVCLGGPTAVHEAADPWLGQVRALLARAVAARLAVLGIGLGARLLATATGGTVRTIPDGPEVGTLLVARRDVAGDDALFTDLPHLPDVMQFHTDEVHVLPARATLLASSPQSVNQAFRVGTRAYGLQFHIGTTPEIVLAWARRAPEVAACARTGELAVERLGQAHADIEEAWRPFVEQFVRMMRGTLSTTYGGGPELPLL